MEDRRYSCAEDIALAAWSHLTGDAATAAAGDRMLKRLGWRMGIADVAGAAARLSRLLAGRWRGRAKLEDWRRLLDLHPELRMHLADWWAVQGEDGRVLVDLACLAGLRHCCSLVAYGLHHEPVPDAAAAVVRALREAHA